MDKDMRAAAIKELTALYLQFLKMAPQKEAESFLHVFINAYYAGWDNREVSEEVVYARDVDNLLRSVGGQDTLYSKPDPQKTA